MAAESFAALWRVIVRSVDPRTPAEAAIVQDEIRLTRGASDVTDFVLPLAAALVAFACREWMPAPMLIGWTAGVTLMCAAVWYAGRRVNRWPLESVDGVRKWARARTAMTAIFLATWCTMGIFLWVPGILLNHMFLILVLASSLAAANTMTAAHPATAFSNILIHGTIMVARPLFAGDPLDLAVSGLSLIFVLLIASQARVVHASARRTRELQFEREVLIRDLSDAKKDSDRERARASLAGRTRSEFLSNMNHELRTPMNAILGFSELIKSKAFGDAADKYTEYAGIIHDSGLHLLALINDMLDLAKIEGGKLSLRENQFSIGHLISDVAAEHEGKAAENGLSLSLKIEKNLPQIYADERAVRQIMFNLLSNAVKFTPSGGAVTAFAHREPDGRVAFGVEDTGIGIEKDAQDQVFERFGRGRHDVANAGRGTGLGLAIVKGFAEAHDGDVTLESDIGAGTRVTVYLPNTRVQTALKKVAG
jgi:two-component system, cell cycle sensor histidine kinase PleC